MSLLFEFRNSNKGQRGGRQSLTSSKAGKVANHSHKTKHFLFHACYLLLSTGVIKLNRFICFSTFTLAAIDNLWLKVSFCQHFHGLAWQRIPSLKSLLVRLSGCYEECGYLLAVSWIISNQLSLHFAAVEGCELGYPLSQSVGQWICL